MCERRWREEEESWRRKMLIERFLFLLAAQAIAFPQECSVLLFLGSFFEC